MNKEVFNEWVRITALLNQKLAELKKLEKNKENLLNSKEDSVTLKIKMYESVKEYQRLLNEIDILEKEAERLKEML